MGSPILTAAQRDEIQKRLNERRPEYDRLVKYVAGKGWQLDQLKAFARLRAILASARPETAVFALGQATEALQPIIEIEAFMRAYEWDKELLASIASSPA